MSTNEVLRSNMTPDWGVPTEFPPAAELTQAADRPDVWFRPGKGGEMAPEWASYMLNQWWAAREKKLTFAEAVRLTAAHFMIGDQP